MFLRPFCTRLFKDLKTYFRSSDYSVLDALLYLLEEKMNHIVGFLKHLLQEHGYHKRRFLPKMTHFVIALLRQDTDVKFKEDLILWIDNKDSEKYCHQWSLEKTKARL